MILIIGTPDDMPSAFIHHKLSARGELAYFVDTNAFPQDWQMSFDPTNLSQGIIRFEGQAPQPLSEVKSVYRRWSRGVNAPNEADPVLREAVYWNLDSAIGSFFRCFDCLWVNSQEATEMHKYKGYQLKLLAEVGIRIPKTLITNHPDHVIEFYHAMGKQVIYKPVRGWAHTEPLRDQDLTPERLEGLKQSPIKLQEMIEGTDIRVYVVGDDIFAMEIQTSALDFREDTAAKRVPIELPDSVAEDCFKLTKTLDMVFTGIDLRRTPDGEYVFFEGNPTPVFIHDEETSGYPISDRIIDLLIRGK